MCTYIFIMPWCRERYANCKEQIKYLSFAESNTILRTTSAALNASIAISACFILNQTYPTLLLKIAVFQVTSLFDCLPDILVLVQYTFRASRNVRAALPTCPISNSAQARLLITTESSVMVSGDDGEEVCSWRSRVRASCHDCLAWRNWSWA